MSMVPFTPFAVPLASVVPVELTSRSVAVPVPRRSSNAEADWPAASVKEYQSASPLEVRRPRIELRAAEPASPKNAPLMDCAVAIVPFDGPL
jgi:hypothetical protein